MKWPLDRKPGSDEEYLTSTSENWQILSQSDRGFRFCRGANFRLSRRKEKSPLTQGLNYRSACDECSLSTSGVFLPANERQMTLSRWWTAVAIIAVQCHNSQLHHGKGPGMWLGAFNTPLNFTLLEIVLCLKIHPKIQNLGLEIPIQWELVAKLKFWAPISTLGGNFCLNLINHNISCSRQQRWADASILWSQTRTQFMMFLRTLP